MSTSTLGLNLSHRSLATPAAFIAWNWFYAYCALSSRTIKQIYGIDHNGNPRQDLHKYGAEAVKAGKLTNAQLQQIQRIESASANSTEGFIFFTASVLFALVAHVPASTLTAAATTYTLARLVYGGVYVFVSDDRWSQFRGISWWVSNFSCLYLLWNGAQQGAA